MNHFPDCDDGPTKAFLIEHRNDKKYQKFYQWSFGKRPAEELYDIINDPDQLNNLVPQPAYDKQRIELLDQLMKLLKLTKDPRVMGGGDKFDQYPYRAGYKLRKDQS